jgi:iron(III) transport system substrate-binding protein
MRARLLTAALGAVLTTACAPGADEPGEQVLRVYTTVTQDTVDAVVEAFADVEPDVEVEVFRAPTAEFNARIAAERREGRIRADVFWLTEPPSMLQFQADNIVDAWEPTRVLNLVLVTGEDASPSPAGWADLGDPSIGQDAAVFDPGFAGSGIGLLGWFSQTDAFGTGWFEQLAAAGVTQVQAPGDVLAGVAEGRFSSGITLDKSARDAIDAGSPVRLVWPSEGAIRVISPIAVLTEAGSRHTGERFVDFVVSRAGQEAIAGTGWQPARDDVGWEHQAEPAVEPDWQQTFDRQVELLDAWRSAFGG